METLIYIGIAFIFWGVISSNEEVSLQRAMAPAALWPLTLPLALGRLIPKGIKHFATRKERLEKLRHKHTMLELAEANKVMNE